MAMHDGWMECIIHKIWRVAWLIRISGQGTEGEMHGHYRNALL